MPSTISAMPASVAERTFCVMSEGDVMALSAGRARYVPTVSPASRAGKAKRAHIQKRRARFALPALRLRRAALRGFELAPEVLQFIGVQVADRPEREAWLGPAAD